MESRQNSRQVVRQILVKDIREKIALGKRGFKIQERMKFRGIKRKASQEKKRL